MPITKIEEFLEIINELTGTGEYLYRGQANEEWPLRSGAARRMWGINGLVLMEGTAIYCEWLIMYAKKRRHHHRADTTVNDLELLAELQHYGAATFLLDFTRNPLAALWFACTSEDKTNGKVFIINRVGNDFKDIHYQDVETFSANKLFKEKRIYIWDPSHINERIPVQASIFLFGKEPFELNIENIKTIEVHQNSKKEILKKLDKVYGLNENFLFPDFHGFAKANNANTPIPWWEKLNGAGPEIDPACNINLYTQVISENPIMITPYYYRAEAYIKMENYEKARQDFEKAKELAIEQKDNELLKDIEVQLKKLDDLEAEKKKSSGSGEQPG